MRLPLLAAVVLLAGCSGPAPGHDALPPQPAAGTASEQAVAFEGSDHAYVCPPAGPACAVSGPNPTKTFEFTLDNDTSLTALALTIAAARGVSDGRPFHVEASCSANGDNQCGRGRILLAEADGPLPLALDAPALDVPAGIRIVVSVRGSEAAPGIANTPQEYVGDGTLHLLRWP